ncbi:MAG: hypothetical protein N2V78_08900 [Methanophagales archaeon]|nr:hypothetical protein [Methanophagales archaeon]
MPEDEALKKYPLPDSKPLKIDGTAIEYIIVTPKGYKEYPKETADAEQEQAENKISSLEQENKQLKEQNEQLSAKLSKFEEMQKKQTIEDIVRMKKALSLDVNEEELNKQSIDSLNVIRATLSQIPVKKEKPAEKPVKAKLSTESQLSDEEKIGKEMFGDNYIPWEGD